jgi:hypothetical protein
MIHWPRRGTGASARLSRLRNWEQLLRLFGLDDPSRETSQVASRSSDTQSAPPQGDPASSRNTSVRQTIGRFRNHLLEPLLTLVLDKYPSF